MARCTVGASTFFLTDGRKHRGGSGAPVLSLERGPQGLRRWWLLEVHSSRMDVSGRNAMLDEGLGLHCARYADALRMLTRPESG